MQQAYFKHSTNQNGKIADFGFAGAKHDKQPINEATDSFRNYIRRFRDSPYTKQAYTTWIRRFMEYSNREEVVLRTGVLVGDNTDKLLFDRDSVKIESHVKSYFDYLDNTLHLAPKTRGSYFDGVKRFYKSNRIMLEGDSKEYVGCNSNIVSNIDTPYTYEEIHKMLDKCDERKRVIIYLLASTGMRRGAIPELKYGDLKYNAEYGIYEITVYSGTSESYITYCSLECANAIDSYIDYRRRCGEGISPESYLIRKQFNKQNNIGTITVSDVNDPPQKHKLSLGTLQTTIYNLIYDSGIRNYQDKKSRIGERHANMAAHAFRKFFENKCLEAGVDPFYVEVLMGHNIGVAKHYYRPRAIEGKYSLLELYAERAMPYLTVSDESRVKAKNRELEIRLKEENSKFDKLAAQILALNKRLGLE
jgi:integrase